MCLPRETAYIAGEPGSFALGLLVEAFGREERHEVRTQSGRFVRPTTRFRNWVTEDGSPGPSGDGGFAAARDRYHLYISLACPWAHRTLIVRMLKGLEDVISLSVVEPLTGPHGWHFGAIPDTVNGKSELADDLSLDRPALQRRVSVPVLWDKERQTIVSNKSSEIIRMFNDAFGRFTNVATDYYPSPLRDEIDRINDLIYPNINNGVYAAGLCHHAERLRGGVSRAVRGA